MSTILDPVNVFAYGTLMFDAVWSRVVAGRYPSAPAVLRGFVRRGVRGRSYPGLVPGDPATLVSGILYQNLTREDLERLDRFEGDQYERQEVVCVTDSGVSVAAMVYVFQEQWRWMLEDGDWDPVRFCREGIAAFMAGYEGFGDVRT